jgi:hypothetical protein
MDFHFSNYDIAELTQCGHEFERTFVTTALCGYIPWTSGVLEWFQGTAASNIRVHPAVGEGTKGEFLVDLCHTTYPLHDETFERWPSTEWYDRALAEPCRMKLALESEWGKWGNGDQSLVMVLDDACKLAVLRASVKVIVFSSHWADKSNRVVEKLRNLRGCHGDTDPWLWIDVPNDPKSLEGQQRVIRHGTFVG